MRVELLVVRDCPHQIPAHEVLAEAAALAGVTGVEITTTMIDTEDEARRRGFPGSPTFLIDGIDPFAVPGARPAVACRLYATATGLSGTADVEALRGALLRARTGPTNAADDP